MRVAELVVGFLRDWYRLGLRFALASVSPAGSRVKRVQLKNGPSIFLRPGTTDVGAVRDVFKSCQYGNEWSNAGKSLRAWYDEILQSDRQPVIIDAGANIGAASLWFAAQYPKARILAIEPEPGNAALCRSNVGDTVEVIEAAIGSQVGHVEVHCPALGHDAFRTVRTASGVAVRTISDLMSTQDGACELFIVKVDIEGFESDLFSAGTDWISSTKGVMIELHDWMLPGQGTSRSFQTAMAGAGFEIMLSGENLIYTRPMVRSRQLVDNG
jgi:FkbM family methyltransferase